VAASPRARKFSGNSLRCRRDHLLYHGTILYDFVLGQIGECLRPPPRQPAYRGGRSHDEFLVNLPLDRPTIAAALRHAWRAETPLTNWPQQRLRGLLAAKYLTPQWNEHP